MKLVRYDKDKKYWLKKKGLIEASYIRLIWKTCLKILIKLDRYVDDKYLLKKKLIKLVKYDNDQKIC